MFNIFNLFRHTNNEEEAKKVLAEQLKKDSVEFYTFNDASLFYLNTLKELVNITPKGIIPEYSWKGNTVTVPGLIISTLSDMRNGYEYRHWLLELEEFWEANTKTLAVKDHILLMEFQTICSLPWVDE